MLLIYVPCKNESEAKKIGRVLVKEKLVCCANVIPKMRSVFIWNGKLDETTEALLLMKTVKPYAKVKKRIEQLHSYSVPAIAAFKIKINPKYEKWAKVVQKVGR